MTFIDKQIEVYIKQITGQKVYVCGICSTCIWRTETRLKISEYSVSRYFRVCKRFDLSPSFTLYIFFQTLLLGHFFDNINLFMKFGIHVNINSLGNVISSCLEYYKTMLHVFFKGNVFGRNTMLNLTRNDTPRPIPIWISPSFYKTILNYLINREMGSGYVISWAQTFAISKKSRSLWIQKDFGTLIAACLDKTFASTWFISSHS